MDLKTNRRRDIGSEKWHEFECASGNWPRGDLFLEPSAAHSESVYNMDPGDQFILTSVETAGDTLEELTEAVQEVEQPPESE